MTQKRINRDLVRERAAATFDQQALSTAIYGPVMHAKLAHLNRLMAGNKGLTLSHVWNCDSSTRYMKACGMAEELVRIIRENALIGDEDYTGALQVLVGEDMFLQLHLTMFLSTLEALCDDEQAAEWLPLARDFRILGTYAQTELSHGSNVARLETVAELDLTTDEWILNTPTITARKWWVGGLARSCTHCILMARLVIKGKDYGVHPFFLQIRDLETHRSLPGISLVHIGQKMGYNGMDNGSLHLTNVRIPRRNLLMRFYEVLPDGTYRTKGSRKLLYSALTYTRKQIILSAGAHLSRSLVIAIRYAAIRRQFAAVNDPSAEEVQVLDYSTTQRTLMPLLGMAVGFISAGRWTEELYRTFKNEAATGNFDRLPELHLVTSSLKAYMTLAVSDGIEKCRKSCGGHGYMLASGISLHFLNFVPQATYEGDFVVLSIQAGRSLLKALQDKMQADVSTKGMNSSVAYLDAFNPTEQKQAVRVTADQLTDPAWLLSAFEKRAAAAVLQTGEKFVKAGGGAMTAAAVDAVKVDFTKITVAHAQQLVIRCFKRDVEKLRESSPREYQVLRDLLVCISLAWIDEHLADFLLADVFTLESATTVATTLASACATVRKLAVAVADSFHHSDNFLNSALGRYDGNVYETLYESTEAEKLNSQDVADAYYKHIQYILHPERKASSKL